MAFVWFNNESADTKTDCACPSLKKSLSVMLNFLDWRIKSRFLISIICLSLGEESVEIISVTQSSTFFMPDAISLMVSRKMVRWFISSGIRESIFFNAVHFLLSSWNISSGRRIRRSSNSGQWLWSRKSDSLIFNAIPMSAFLNNAITRSCRRPGDCASA